MAKIQKAKKKVRYELELDLTDDEVEVLYNCLQKGIAKYYEHTMNSISAAHKASMEELLDSIGKLI